MGMRSFAGIITLTGSAQPLFGVALTAAATPPPDQFSGNLNPGSNETQVTLVVTSTDGFRAGDVVAVGPTATFKPGITTSIPDRGMVKSITDATHMVVQGLQHSHAASGEWVVLNNVAGNVHCRPVVTTAAVYIGNASTVAAGDPSVIDVLPIVASGAGPAYVFDAESIGISQPFNLAEFWMVGTAADTVLPRWTEV